MKETIYHAMVEWFRLRNRDGANQCKTISPRIVIVDGTYNFELLAAHLEMAIKQHEEEEGLL